VRPEEPSKRDPVRISFNERLRTYLRLEQLYRRLRELLTPRIRSIIISP
jgi:hypothetical protein